MPVNAWSAIKACEQTTLSELFHKNPDRTAQLSLELGGVYFDFSKTHLDSSLIDGFGNLANVMGLNAAKEALFTGEIVNPTEQRAAEHCAERGSGNADSVKQAKGLQHRMRALIEAIDAGAMGEIKHILHIGIGGSALGPKLLVDALGRDGMRYDVKVVSNVDGAALAEAISGFDPHRTLIAVASKTFTTTETLLNADSALNWLKVNGVNDPQGKVIALTANPDAALEWGVDESRILPFNETVGGRYSLWCSIGFPAAVALGWAAFEEMLEGAAVMDRHFRTAPVEKNAPVLAAFVDLYYAQIRKCQTRAVFAYDERLRLLPDYLQQLEMESNGKSVTVNGEKLTHDTAPITWGGVGTDAQHAVFQLLHQGTHLIPVEFIASATPGHDLDPAHHETLLVNCFAQGAALMAGKTNDDPAKRYAGDRPSTTLFVDDVTPTIVGALIAFYEQRVFANAVLLGINPFDQFGVELGKQIAKEIGENGATGFDPSTTALIARAGI
jgi:glucose-6-phosphate isomerase